MECGGSNVGIFSSFECWLFFSIFEVVCITFFYFDRQTPPAPRFDHSAAVHAERYLLIFGGCSHSRFFNDLHVLDLQTVSVEFFIFFWSFIFYFIFIFIFIFGMSCMPFIVNYSFLE